MGSKGNFSQMFFLRFKAKNSDTLFVYSKYTIKIIYQVGKSVYIFKANNVKFYDEKRITLFFQRRR